MATKVKRNEKEPAKGQKKWLVGFSEFIKDFQNGNQRWTC